MEIFPQAQGADADPRSHALLVETVRELEQELRGRDLSLESQQITIEVKGFCWGISPKPGTWLCACVCVF